MTVTIVFKEQSYKILNYLKSTDKQLGLLINFGHYPKIEHERFVNQALPYFVVINNKPIMNLSSYN